MSSLASTLVAAIPSARIYDWLASKPRVPRPRPMAVAQQPSNDFLMHYVTALTFAAVLMIITFKSTPNARRQDIVQSCGVSLRKVARSVSEIQRKGFHIAGLLVPLCQLLLLRVGFTQSDCVRLCWTITVVGTSCDWMRLHSAFVARHWPLRSILREHEHKQLTGGCYFSLGCTLAICARARTHADARARTLHSVVVVVSPAPHISVSRTHVCYAPRC